MGVFYKSETSASRPYLHILFLCTSVSPHVMLCQKCCLYTPYTGVALIALLLVEEWDQDLTLLWWRLHVE